MKKYWFYLEPYTFLWKKKEKVLLYNTLSGRHVSFELDSDTKSIVNSWDDADNMFGAELTESDMEKKSVQALISQVRETFTGDIVELTSELRHPISLKPFLNFQMERKRVENLKRSYSNKQYGEKILHHLFEISIYVGGKCLNDCTFCNDYYKQTVCCTKKGSKIIQPMQIEKLLQNVVNSSVRCINILGGDLFSNTFLLEYVNALNRFGYTKNYYSHYLTISEHICLIKSNNATLQIVVTFPLEVQKFEQAYNLVDIGGLNVFWTFIVSSEVEYFQADELTKKFEIQKLKITPFYNGSNYDFFSENIFTTLEDINLLQLNRRQIFANQSINTAEFGKITVMPDGKIYANVNHEAIGNINDDIRELIYDELVNGKSWLCIRDQKPCSDCIYQWLCPSPSGYEIAIGRYNLCHIE